MGLNRAVVDGLESGRRDDRGLEWGDGKVTNSSDLEEGGRRHPPMSSSYSIFRSLRCHMGLNRAVVDGLESSRCGERGLEWGDGKVTNSSDL